MEATKTTKKKAAKKATKSATKKSAARKPARKAPVKKFTPKKLQSLLDEMLGQFADQIKEDGVRYTANEGLKLYQIRKDLLPEEPKDVRVEWVEPKE